MKVAYSPIYKYRLPEGHRFPMIKYELLPMQLLHQGVIDQNDLFQPGFLTESEILKTHTVDYWEKLKTLTLDRKEIRDIGFPVRADLIERGRYIAMGSVQCAMHALAGEVCLNIAGGTHHAFADRGEGFCLFNDFAIVSNYLLSRKLVKKILILDLDVHQGNGTAKIFESNPSVYTCSVHGQKNYPLRKEQSDLDVGLEDGTLDQEYLQTLESLLPKLIEKVRPELILYLAGVDVLESDKLGRLALSLKGCYQRDRLVFECCKQYKIPVSVSMGGGYSKDIKVIIDAHANTFKAARDVLD